MVEPGRTLDNEPGYAFLAQQVAVMAAVQRLRASAQANGRLTSTPQQTVSTETQAGQPAIIIQPANPDVVYVPTYDPAYIAYIWRPPGWGSYPTLYYPTYGFGWGPGIDLGFWGGWGWGRTGSAVRSLSTTASFTAMDFTATGTTTSTVNDGHTIQGIFDALTKIQDYGAMELEVC